MSLEAGLPGGAAPGVPGQFAPGAEPRGVQAAEREARGPGGGLSRVGAGLFGAIGEWPLNNPWFWYSHLFGPGHGTPFRLSPY